MSSGTRGRAHRRRCSGAPWSSGPEQAWPRRHMPLDGHRSALRACATSLWQALPHPPRRGLDRARKVYLAARETPTTRGQEGMVRAPSKLIPPWQQCIAAHARQRQRRPPKEHCPEWALSSEQDAKACCSPRPAPWHRFRAFSFRLGLLRPPQQTQGSLTYRIAAQVRQVRCRRRAAARCRPHGASDFAARVPELRGAATRRRCPPSCSTTARPMQRAARARSPGAPPWPAEPLQRRRNREGDCHDKSGGVTALVREDASVGRARRGRGTAASRPGDASSSQSPRIHQHPTPLTAPARLYNRPRSKGLHRLPSGRPRPLDGGSFLRASGFLLPQQRAQPSATDQVDERAERS
eukprot:scaffold838_cov251-Pinguiococcus_pyrenoidosus.AAC.5